MLIDHIISIQPFQASKLILILSHIQNYPRIHLTVDQGQAYKHFQLKNN